ncbi:MAG TPA: hypothetical protein ENG24_03345 [Thermoplasmatales archaeon]|nr:hypothetical protein [Thermoplasmatales archaeon]
MKMYCMITGCEIVHTAPGAENTIFKLTLTPLTNVKQDINVMDAMEKGSILDIISMVKQEAFQPQHIVYITQREWMDRGYKIGRHVTIEILPDDTTGGIR